MIRKIALVGLVLGLVSPASAQFQAPPVLTIPYPGSTAGGNASGTIAANSTFQKVWGAAAPGTPRHGCLIENNGSNTMYVAEATTTPSTSNSYVLAKNTTWTCNIGGVVLQGEIDISGTMSDAFYAGQF